MHIHVCIIIHTKVSMLYHSLEDHNLLFISIFLFVGSYNFVIRSHVNLIKKITQTFSLPIMILIFVRIKMLILLITIVQITNAIPKKFHIT